MANRLIRLDGRTAADKLGIAIVALYGRQNGVSESKSNN